MPAAFCINLSRATVVIVTTKRHCGVDAQALPGIMTDSDREPWRLDDDR